MYEWDEQKRLFNIDKPGMDFTDAVQVFDGRPQFTYRSSQNGSQPWQSLRGKFGSLFGHYGRTRNG